MVLHGGGLWRIFVMVYVVELGVGLMINITRVVGDDRSTYFWTIIGYGASLYESGLVSYSIWQRINLV